MRYRNIGLFSFLAAMLCMAPLSSHAAAVLSSTFMTGGGSAAVTVTNNGPDAVYNVSLQPSGVGVSPQAAAVTVGDIVAGGTVSFMVNGVDSSGYIFLNGSGTDAAGQPVSIAVVSKEK